MLNSFHFVGKTKPIILIPLLTTRYSPHLLILEHQRWLLRPPLPADNSGPWFDLSNNGSNSNPTSGIPPSLDDKMIMTRAKGWNQRMSSYSEPRVTRFLPWSTPTALYSRCDISRYATSWCRESHVSEQSTISNNLSLPVCGVAWTRSFEKSARRLETSRVETSPTNWLRNPRSCAHVMSQLAACMLHLSELSILSYRLWRRICRR